MRKIISALLASALVLGLSVAPVAACDPGRSNSPANLFVEERFVAQSGVNFNSVSAKIEETNVYRELGGQVNQYLELRSGDGLRKVFAGLAYTRSTGGLSQIRVYVRGYEPSGNVGPLFYSYDAAQFDQLGIQIRYFGNGVYRINSGSTTIATINFDQDWKAKVASKWVTSNNHGNQIPGTASNPAYFLSAEYSTQFGTASWNGGTFILPTPFPVGATFGRSSGGMFYTRDNNCAS